MTFSDSFPEGSAIAIVNSTCDVGLQLKGIIDIEKEIAKLTDGMKKLKQKRVNLTAKMEKPGYVKAKDEVKAKDKDTLDQLAQELEKMEITVSQFEKMK